MKTFRGYIPYSDMKIAISEIRKLKPNAKRMFINVKDTKLEFITILGGNPFVVHSVPVEEKHIEDAQPDEQSYNGYPICVSIPLYEEAAANCIKKDLSCKPTGMGRGCACPIH
jgi:hypothetical protein